MIRELIKIKDFILAVPRLYRLFPHGDKKTQGLDFSVRFGDSSVSGGVSLDNKGRIEVNLYGYFPDGREDIMPRFWHKANQKDFTGNWKDTPKAIKTYIVKQGVNNDKGE